MRLGGQGQAVLEPDILADRECVGPAQGGAGLHGLTTGGRWIFGAAKPQPVEDQFKVTSEQLSPMRAAADSPIAASLSRVMHAGDDDATTVESEGGILAASPAAETLASRPCSLEACGSPAARFLQFDVEDRAKLLLVAIERGPAGVDFYSFELDGWPHSPAEIRLIDDNGSGVQIGVSTSVGSGHFMTLRIFDPATGRVWNLGDSLGDGGYRLLRFGGGVPFAVLVSAEDDRRFSECMHCPARFVTALVRFEPSTRTYAAVAERRTGTDVPAGAVNLLGLSPKMFDYREREEDLFGRLSNHSPDYIAGDLVKDVDAAVGFINSRYCAEHEFSAAAQKYQLIIKALSADGDSAAVRQARAEVQIDLLVTLISSGDYSLGLRPRGAMLARMCGRVRLSSDVSEIKLVFAVPPDRPTPNIAPSWNVAPTDSLPVDEQRQRHADRSAIVVTAWEIARQKGATIEERWEIYEREVGRLSREFEEKWGVPARV